MDENEGGNRYEKGAEYFDEATGCARALWLASATAERPNRPDFGATAEQREAYEGKCVEDRSSFAANKTLQKECDHLHKCLLLVNGWRKEGRRDESDRRDALAKCLKWEFEPTRERPDFTTAEELWLPAKPDDRFDVGKLSLGYIYDNRDEVERLVSKLRLAADRCLVLARPSTGK
jgi:hypothetical protein